MAQFDTIRTSGAVRTAEIDEGLRAHMNKVYGTMSVGLLLTFAAAWAVGNNAAMMQSLFTGFTRYIVMFAPLIMVFAFGAMINKLSAAGAQLFFYAFSAVMGISISYIFAMYTGVSVAQTFLVTSIAFAGLSLYGYTTKKEARAVVLAGLGGLGRSGGLALHVDPPAQPRRLFQGFPAEPLAGLQRVCGRGAFLWRCLTAFGGYQALGQVQPEGLPLQDLPNSSPSSRARCSAACMAFTKEALMPAASMAVMAA